MNYFRKTKFRESSLLIVALFVAIIYFTTNTISYEQSKDVQELIDKRVEEALKAATTTTLPNNTTTTTTTNTYLGSFQYESIRIGSVTDVRFYDSGKVSSILIDDSIWVSTGSSVQLYLSNSRIAGWDFEQGDYVVAVLVGPIYTTETPQQAASRIYIIANPEKIPLEVPNTDK